MPLFSADGQFLATTTKGGTIQLWDTKTGESQPVEKLSENLSRYSPPRSSILDSLLSFDRMNQRVLFAGDKIVQIPPYYGARKWVAHGSIIVLGCESGRVIFLSF
jgi:WD40 repeat protein